MKKNRGKRAHELKTINHGIRFKPSTFHMLTALSLINDESKSTCIENLIIEAFKKMKEGN